MSIEFENDFDMVSFKKEILSIGITYEIYFLMQEIVNALAEFGHNYTIAEAADGFAAITAISNNGEIEALSDTRRPGAVAYIY